MSKRSDYARDIIAEISAQNLKDIMENVSPSTLSSNQTAWENQINGYEASTDKSLDASEDEGTDDSNDAKSTDDKNAYNEYTECREYPEDNEYTEDTE